MIKWRGEEYRTWGDALRAKDAEMERLTADSEKLTLEIAEVVLDNERLRATCKDREAEIKSLSGHLDAATTRNKRLRAALEKQDDLVAVLEQTVNALSRYADDGNRAIICAAENAIEFHRKALQHKDPDEDKNNE